MKEIPFTEARYGTKAIGAVFLERNNIRKTRSDPTGVGIVLCPGNVMRNVARGGLKVREREGNHDLLLFFSAIQRKRVSSLHRRELDWLMCLYVCRVCMVTLLNREILGSKGE